MTPVKLSVVTFDIENLHFDIDTCMNKHSGMITDQKWPMAHANMQHIDRRSYAWQSKKAIVLDCNRASVSGRMDVIYVRILLPYAENFDPGRMTYVQSLSVTPAWCFTDV